MQFSLRIGTFLLFYSTIIGICGVQQSGSDNQSTHHLSPASASQNGSGSPDLIPDHEYPDIYCPTSVPCDILSPFCLVCNFNESCVYGETYSVTCTPKGPCVGERKLQKTLVCRYCYQTEPSEHTCTQRGNCNAVGSPQAHFRANCSVHEDVLCHGKRRFLKNQPCDWTGGCKWSIAMVLSITLGGFGADRFYLGQWQEGIGKLFSFGGLGVWTLIDVILISIHYLGPSDGSLYL